ncbi:PTS sugar transporter subunit IIC [Limisalsivibrio acetivorans]|uniref:PTS sugar transporter subunit IIC n=1 Tax=Limisalsivibrio acetivorans TaxID=1304888 RepID=UPI0003B3CB54|nr:PTS sugar transporter subunit IIC [Limisalsivibrio acetivorans]
MKMFLLLVYSGLITVDRGAGFNLMISRPIVVSVVIGSMYGYVLECFLAGLLFEIIGLVDVPVGTRITKDDSFGAYAASLLISFHAVTSMSNYILGLLLILVVMFPVTYSEQISRQLNKALYLRELKKGERFSASKLIHSGLIIHFFQGMVVYNLAFVVIFFVYDQLTNFLPCKDNFTPYLVFTFMFLSGFLLRFLSGSSAVKYMLFVAGAAAGWVLI